MDMQDIIIKKRNGGELTEQEIRFFVSGYVAERIPDYQMSALLMAIFFQKLNRKEIHELTLAMRDSGDQIDLSGIRGIKVDKHSTGGVGDKTTLITAPIAAACGVPVAKMSGRGLGFSGGTIDKLESIPGFSTSLTPEEFTDQVNRIGIALTGQTGSITPADKKIYVLRDVTGTVENTGLIASSIMSKKLAAGSDAIVLDVKCGSGAFMKTLKDARDLAQIMCDIGEDAGKRTAALITNMDQPLGRAVGNALEVEEAIRTLKGLGPEDITELAVRLAGVMTYLGGRARTPDDGAHLARQALLSGAALEKFRQLIEAQGGDSRILDDLSLLPQASYVKEILSEKNGYVQSVDAGVIGAASQHIGAGRMEKGDRIDLSAGIVLLKKTDEKVSRGDVIAKVCARSRKLAEAGADEIRDAFVIERGRPGKPVLVRETVGLDQE
jgi:pyrimidine-nucleoside phosphorylase